MHLDVEDALQEAWKHNFENFELSEAKDAIDRFVLRTGEDRNRVVDKIKKDPMFRWWFVKDPKRQNFYKNAAAKHIKKMDNVSEFKTLGAKAKLICGGMIISQREIKTKGGYASAKPIDFQWDTGKFTVYACHKYTEESGGAQGNQYRTLLDFISEARESILQDTKFVVIADGPFYGKMDERAGATRMDNLKRHAGGEVVTACSLDELPGVLERLGGGVSGHEAIIKKGETEKVEFKSSMLWDYRTDMENKDLADAVLKAIAAFMNKDGGTLYVGVSDDGTIRGLENDYKCMTKGNWDKWSKRFTNKFRNVIGVEHISSMSFKMVQINGKDVAVFTVCRSKSPVYMDPSGKAEFYVRVGTTSQPFNTRAASEYIREHFET